MAQSSKRHFWKLRPLSVKEGLERIALSHDNHCQFIGRKTSFPQIIAQAQHSPHLQQQDQCLHSLMYPTRDVHCPPTSTVDSVLHPPSPACASSDQRPLDPGRDQRSQTHSNVSAIYSRTSNFLSWTLFLCLRNPHSVLLFINLSCLHLNFLNLHPLQHKSVTTKTHLHFLVFNLPPRSSTWQLSSLW